MESYNVIQAAQPQAQPQTTPQPQPRTAPQPQPRTAPQSQTQTALQPQPQTAPQSQTLSALIKSPAVKEQFSESLKAKGDSFLASVLTTVNTSALLQKAEPATILSAAMVAASLELPIVPSLGFAALVPFRDGKTGTCVCQFQIMARGLVQLALRTGQYRKIEVEAVHTGEIKSRNRFTGDIEFGEATDDKVVGYLGFFELCNGFHKFMYMSNKEISEHAKKYSQTAKRGFGLWVDNYDAMARKTVLKLLLAKWGPLSVEMQTALLRDQTSETGDNAPPTYVDNTPRAEETPAPPSFAEDIKNSMATSVRS